MNGLSFPEMLARCASLPPHSAIFYVLLSVDSEGVFQVESAALKRLHAATSAPIFGVHRTQLGYGIVGGPLISMDDLSSTTAGVATRMLNGEVPGNIKTSPQAPGPPVYDWRELRRWNIRSDVLPPESIVLFRDRGVWERYKWYIAVGAVDCRGPVLLIVVLLANRSKRRRAEAAVRESSNRLTAILGTAVEGIVTTDEVGVIESVNIGLEKMFGYGELELAGQNVSRLMAGISFSPDATEVNLEAQGTRKDGSIFPVAVAVSAVALAARVTYTGFVRDITERKRAEQLASEFGLRLVQAEDAERARVARELNDDISQRLARLAIDAVRVDSATNRDQQHTMHEIQDGLRRLSKDVHSLAYRLHPSLLESLGLANSIRMDCERFSRQHSISVGIELGDIPRMIPQDDALCLLRVNQEALQNVARHAGVSSADITLRKMQEGLQLTVKDTGIGFHVEQQKSRNGLASIRERLRLIGGKLDIESRPGQGTMVLAWIPLRNLLELTMISRPRVLLAEDHARVAEVLKSILEDEFDVVGTVADGLMLLDAAATLRPDVIVADMSMPRLDGLSALLKLKEKQSDVKVVLITMYDEPSIARIALDSGALGFVMKHSAATDLVPAVRAAIDGKTYLSPILVEKE